MLDQISPEKIEQWLPVVSQYAVKVIGALVLITIAFLCAGYAKKLAITAMTKSRVEPTLAKFFGNIAKWSILITGGISILGVFGVQTASFAAVIAAMGLAIGLAFQGTLSNLASGIMLLIFRPFKVGQFIRVSGETGTVDEIGIFSTMIDTPDRRRVILPNSSVFGSTIENATHHPIRRCDIEVGTAYDADLEKTKSVLLATMTTNDMVLADPPPVVVLTGLGASSIDWSLRAFVKTDDYWTARERMFWNCKYALDKNGIGIPFPQMDVHLFNPQK